MATIDNLISVSFTQQELDDINQALTTIETVLQGKVINLTPEQRQLYGKLNNNTENWIDKVGDHMEQKPNLIPFYLNKQEFDRDRKTRNAMKPVLNRLASIVESVDDTSKLLSTDIYNAAIAYYRNIKLISMQNVAGTSSGRTG